MYNFYVEKAKDLDILIDVSDKAEEVGFTFPVSITKALWNKINDGQNDPEETLWDVLHMGILAIKQKAQSNPIKEIRYFLTMTDRAYQELKIEFNKYDPKLKIELIE